MNKTILLTALISLLAIMPENGFCQETTITGVWNRRNATEISLFQAFPGRLEKIDFAEVGEGNTFSLTFTPTQEGFFAIGIGQPSVRRDKYMFYLKPGDRLEIAVNETTYSLVGENTRENIAMRTWHNFILPLERMALYPPFRETYLDFFPLLETKAERPYRITNTGNKTFDKLFPIYRKYDLMDLALSFLKMGRGRNPERADFPNFYRNLTIEKLTTTSELLLYPYELLIGIAYVDGMLNGVDHTNLIESVRNDTLKGELFLSNLARVRDVSVMEQLIYMYEQYILTNDQKERFEKEKERIDMFQSTSDVGKRGHDFTYVDVNGNQVSFSDFRGKVVYMDVWATWCAPCRAEIPHLKRLKEHFANNENLVIVGISSDRPADFQKWKDFVVEYELGGIQLWGGMQGDENIMRKYQIGGIPRFMIFDKQGNIVSLDAPRPSSAEIIPLLTRLLRQ